MLSTFSSPMNQPKNVNPTFVGTGSSVRPLPNTYSVAAPSGSVPPSRL